MACGVSADAITEGITNTLYDEFQLCERKGCIESCAKNVGLVNINIQSRIS